jgi:hypothetical protein
MRAVEVRRELAPNLLHRLSSMYLGLSGFLLPAGLIPISV